MQVQRRLTSQHAPPQSSPPRQGADFNREFVFHIMRSGSKSQAWVTLRLYDAYGARARVPRARYPRYCGKDNLSGVVELSLPSRQNIASIKLSVRDPIPLRIF